MAAATVEIAIERVLFAIAHIRNRKQQWLDAEADPESSQEERAGAKYGFKCAENEFGIQWENVEKILKERL
jgi:hypothetical protein